jgi:hypothetical protein
MDAMDGLLQRMQDSTVVRELASLEIREGGAGLKRGVEACWRRIVSAKQKETAECTKAQGQGERA